MKRFLIANPKGGVGKSTLATNLAGWIANRGHQVMLGDLDRQQSSRGWLRVRSPELSRIESWNIEPGKPARPPKGTTHVVLDSPAGIHGKALKRAVSVVSHVIVPLQPSIFDIYATRHFLDELASLWEVGHGSIQIGLVGMRVDARTKAAEEMRRFLEATGLPVVTYLRDTQNYVKVAAHGYTIFDLPPSQARVDRESWLPLLRWAGLIGTEEEIDA